MAIIYRTTGAWGAGKGSNLTPAEVDNNFNELKNDIEDILANPPAAAGISNIEVIGTQMKIYLSNGDSYGPYTLPYVMFKSKGDWQPNTIYAILDLLTVPQKGLYLVNVDHESEAEFDPDLMIGGVPVYTLVFPEYTYIYDIAFFYPGKPGFGIASGGYMLAHMFCRDILFTAGLPDSMAKLRVAPTTDMFFPIYVNTTQVGELAFAAGSRDGVFTFDNSVQMQVGNVMNVGAPADGLDADARDLTVTFIGMRVS